MLKLSINKQNQFFCKECGWQFPEDIIEKLLHGNYIYCELCGSKIEMEVSKKSLKSTPKKAFQKATLTLKDIFSTAKGKAAKLKDKIKSKLKDLKEKYKDD